MLIANGRRNVNSCLFTHSDGFKSIFQGCLATNIVIMGLYSPWGFITPVIRVTCPTIKGRWCYSWHFLFKRDLLARKPLKWTLESSCNIRSHGSCSWCFIRWCDACLTMRRSSRYFQIQVLGAWNWMDRGTGGWNAARLCIEWSVSETRLSKLSNLQSLKKYRAHVKRIFAGKMERKHGITNRHQGSHHPSPPHAQSSASSSSYHQQKCDCLSPHHASWNCSW